MAFAVIDATADHLPAFEAIYGRAALKTPATFDLEPRPLTWWEGVLEAADPAVGNHLLAAVDGDRVVGFAKSGPFRDKAAYVTTRETTLYLDDQHRGQGIGTALYAELLARLDRSGVLLATAGVTQPNEASNALHRAHGFTEVGIFEGVGVKFGRPWSVLWYQRPAGASGR